MFETVDIKKYGRGATAPFELDVMLNKKPKAQILYFEREKDGNHIHQLEIDKNGELPSKQPKGYRKFFVKEDMKLLGL